MASASSLATACSACCTLCTITTSGMPAALTRIAKESMSPNVTHCNGKTSTSGPSTNQVMHARNWHANSHWRWAHYAVGLEVNGSVMQGARPHETNKANAQPMLAAIPQANGLLELPV